MDTLLKQTMRGKEVFLEKINKKKDITIKNFLFFVIIFFSFTNNAAWSNENIINYIKTLNDLSSSFIQIEESNSSEGRFFLNNKRLKIEYLSPTNIEVIISKKRGMYFNKDLKEVDFFNPKDSVAEIFYNVFFDSNFLNNASFVDKKSHTIIIKNILLDDIDYKISIFFDKKPIKIRKISIKSLDYEVDLGIYNINLYSNLDDNFFSMVNPLIN